MSVFSWLWVGWAVFFVVVETVAIVNKTRGDTLSENLRALFHTSTVIGRWVWVISLGVLAAWLLVHIVAPGVLAIAGG